MSSTTKSSGNGFGTVLFIVFLVLKLTHVIDWSWLWVFAPLWIPIGLLALIFTIAGIGVLAGGRR